MVTTTSGLKPGQSRIRDCEKWMRDNGLVVLPSSWDADFMRKQMKEKLGPYFEVLVLTQTPLDDVSQHPAAISVLVSIPKG